MPLFIRDPEVSQLADEAVKALGALNKTEAVRAALKSAIAAAQAEVPLAERIEAIQRKVTAIGPLDPTYNHKRDMDEMWGE